MDFMNIRHCSRKRSVLLRDAEHARFFSFVTTEMAIVFTEGEAAAPFDGSLADDGQ